MVKKSPRGEADDLLEAALLKEDHFISLVNPEKYQKAKDWFEKVLMLETYVPEQYMVPLEWIDQPREEAPKTPWEFRTYSSFEE